MSREGTEVVPGCTSDGVEDFEGRDFCIQSSSTSTDSTTRTDEELDLKVVGDGKLNLTLSALLPRLRSLSRAFRLTADGSSQSGYPLSECEADCDSDAECADDLICFHRNNMEVVPGCAGDDEDWKGLDFCINP